MGSSCRPDYDGPDAGRAARLGRSPSPATACRRSSSTGCSCWSGRCSTRGGRFGPMMWAPIANNVISVAVLVVYLVVVRRRPTTHCAAAVHPGPGGAARPRLHARHRRPVAGPAALPARGGLPLPAALRLPRHRARATPCGSASGPCCSWSSTRSRTPSWSGWPRAAPRSRRQLRQRAGARRHRLHGLRQTVPDRDGAARGRHRLAGHRDAAPARRARAADGDLPALAAQPGAGRCAPRWPWSCRSRCCCPCRARPGRRDPWDCGAGQQHVRPLHPSARRSSAPALVFFTVHYLMLRGFYALERTRTVFYPVRRRRHQHRGRRSCSSARTDAEHTAPALVLAYTASYVVGLGGVLPRAAPRLSGGARHARRLVRFLVRLLVAAGVGARRAWRLGHGCCPGRRRPAATLVAVLRLVRRGGRRRRWCSSCSPGCCGSREVTDGHRHGHPAAAAAHAAADDAPTMTRARTERDRRSVPGRRSRAARDPARRRPRRPLPAGRPARRERGRPVLAGPRPGRWTGTSRCTSSRADDERAGCCSRRPGPRRPCIDRRLLRVARRRPTRATALVLRRQRVGLRRLPRHPAGRRRAAGPAPGRLDGLRGRRTLAVGPRGRGRPRPAGPRERPDRPHRRRSGSSASPSTPPCTGCRPDGLPTDVTDLAASSTPRSPAVAGRLAVRRAARAARARPGAAAAAGPGRRPAVLDTLCDEVLNPDARRAGSHAAALRPVHRGRHRRRPARLRRRPDRTGRRRGGRRPAAARPASRSSRPSLAGTLPRCPAWPPGDRAPRPPRSPATGTRAGAGGRAGGRAEPSAADPLDRGPADPGRASRSSTTTRRRLAGCRARREAAAARRRSRSPPSGRCSPPSPSTAARPARHGRARRQRHRARTRRLLAVGQQHRHRRPGHHDGQRRHRGRRRGRRARRAPGRSWLRLAARGRRPALLVLLAVVVAFNLGRGKTPLGAEPESERATDPSPSADRRAPAARRHRDHGHRLRPAGRAAEENPELAALAVDGDPDDGLAHRRPTSSSSGPAGSRPASGWCSTSAPAATSARST